MIFWVAIPQYDIPLYAIIIPAAPDMVSAGNCEMAFCFTIMFLNRYALCAVEKLDITKPRNMYLESGINSGCL